MRHAFTQATFNRLPANAQREIEILRMRLAEANETIEKLQPTLSRITVGHGPHEVKIPDLGRFRFKSPLHSHAFIEFGYQMDDEATMELYSSDRLTIEPSASNVVKVRMVE